MKKWLFVLVVTCVSITISTAQTVNPLTVTGTVLDGDDKTPVGQATVQLLSLPDSAMVVGNVTNNSGQFSIHAGKGNYVLKISFVGYHSLIKSIELSDVKPTLNLGTLVLNTDAIMLGEAIVVAEAPQVTIVEDTTMYNSSAYRTPEGAMLEELVKKLPGAEIDDDGNIKINGKEVKKIMVDGKEFFGGDVKTGLKNLPVEMVDKLKTYDRKSDLARVTGIDDGEEETVLDLSVKKGMNKGWFGNADLGVGTKDRYSGKLMVNHFNEKKQFSLIASGNNVNDQGFSGGGGGPRWKQANGLNATKMVGANFAIESDKLELGGSVRYNYKDADVVSTNASERFLQTGNSFSNSNSNRRTKTNDLNADFRLEWKPDSMTNIIFRPNITYGKSNGLSMSESGTFNKDPYSLVPNPNDYLNISELKILGDDPLKDIRVNTSNDKSLVKSNSLSGNATLQLNRKLNNKGRNITFRGAFGYGRGESEQYLNSETHYYQLEDTIYRNQFITTPTRNYSYSAKFTYSEPIAKATFLQFSYNFQYKRTESDRSTYDLLANENFDIETGLPLGDLPQGYQNQLVDSLSRNAHYDYYNHDITVGMRMIREKYQLSFGVSMQPQYTKLSYKRGEAMGDTTRTVFNFAPNLEYRYRFSKVSQLRITYNGRNGQPSMDNLLPITDNSNPLNIRIGNPGLLPSFTHNMRAFYNIYDAEKQQGMMAHLSFNATQNAISNSTKFNEETGGRTTTPQNINGNWSAFAMYGFNTALPNKKFTINSFMRARYQNQVAFLYNNETHVDDRNRSTNMALSENLNASYRNSWFELTLLGSLEYNWERNKLRPTNNQEPYIFSYGASTNITLPWKTSLSTNLTNQSRRGYNDASMNRNELIWNAQIAQTLLKGAATVSFEVYDILRQQSNITRSLTADMRSVTQYNAVNSYCMVHFIYRLNIFGSKEARQKIESQGGMGGQMGRPAGSHPGFGGHGGGRRAF
ncbi:MAG: TonB-dependent receptor [Phocaeicola sp.]